MLCASTGNTAASSAAYAARAGIPAVVLTPQGAVAGAKLAQTRMLGATVLEVRGDFDQALAAAQELADRGTHVLVNSLNPHRREGQKTAVLEIVEELGGAPDAFVLPYGGGGNTVVVRGRARRARPRDADRLGRGGATGRRTLASAIRIGDPVHAGARRRASARGSSPSPTRRSSPRGAGSPPRKGSSASRPRPPGSPPCSAGDVEGDRLVVTITGHGLKDPAAADALAPPVVPVEPDADAIAAAVRR